MFSVDLKPNDCILMCTDGLSNMVEDADILKIVSLPRILKPLRKIWSQQPMQTAEKIILL